MSDANWNRGWVGTDLNLGKTWKLDDFSQRKILLFDGRTGKLIKYFFF